MLPNGVYQHPLDGIQCKILLDHLQNAKVPDLYIKTYLVEESQNEKWYVRIVGYNVSYFYSSDIKWTWILL